MNKLIVKKKSKNNSNSFFIWISVTLWAALLVVLFISRDKLTAQGIAGIAPDNMLAAALAIIIGLMLKSLTIFFSSGVFFTASGIVFPLPIALLVNLIGTFAVGTIPYFIGRKGGATELDKLCERYPKFSKLRDVPIKNEILFVAMLRINPTFNFDIGSIYLGARKLKNADYYIGNMLGMFPQVLIYTLIGVGLNKGNYLLSTLSVAMSIVLAIASYMFFAHVFISGSDSK